MRGRIALTLGLALLFALLVADIVSGARALPELLSVLTDSEVTMPELHFDLITYMLFALPLGLIPAIIAYQKGRSFWTWWLFGVVAWLIALIVILASPTNHHELDERMIRGGRYVRCPHCAEAIRSDAKVCRHCGRDVAP